MQAVPGGYTASARWDFASGSRQASWLGAHVRVVEADGTPRRKPDGSPEIRTILFPVTSATMYDVWDVIGLTGTGTDSYSVDNLFIPEKFAALRDDPAALREKGPLYKLSTNMVFSMGFAATSLGVARATLDAATDLARGKTPQGLKAMRDNNAVQGLIGRTEGNPARRARLSLCHGRRGLARSGARRRRSPNSTASRCASPRPGPSINRPSVVDTAYHMAGATAVFSANKFERRFRDMHAIAQQIQARDTHYEDAGKAILSANLATPADGDALKMARRRKWPERTRRKQNGAPGSSGFRRRKPSFDAYPKPVRSEIAGFAPADPRDRESDQAA